MNPVGSEGAGRARRWTLWSVVGLSMLVCFGAVYRLSQDPGGTTSAAAPPGIPASGGVQSPSTPGSSDPRRTAVSSDSVPASTAEVDKAGRKRTEPIFDQWRSAILMKNAERVLACDQAFDGDRGRLHDGLAELAEKDSEERVRSFSTRVLGRFAMARDVDLFTRLLENDPSPYVRQNAAWALGLQGKGAPVDALRRVSEGDPDKEVRDAAAKALSQVR